MRFPLNKTPDLLFIVLLIWMPMTGQDSVPDSITLENAIQRVLEHNPSLQETEDAVAIFQARLEQSRTALQPLVRGNLNYTRIGPVSQFDFPPMGKIDLFPANGVDFNAVLRYQIFDFNRRKTVIELNQSQIESARDRVDMLHRELSFQTAQLFYFILFLQESLRFQDAHIQALNEHLSIAQNRVSSGTATDLDILTTQVRVAAAQNQKLDLSNTLEKQFILLKKLLGISEISTLHLQGQIGFEPLVFDPNELIERACMQRIETRAIVDQIKSINIQSRLADLHDRPSLNLNLVSGLKNGFEPNIYHLRMYFAAGLQVDIPIFDGHLGRYQKMEAQGILKTLNDKNQELMENIRSEVRQSIADVQNSLKKIDLVEISQKQAEKALEYAKLRYQAGTVTNLDVLDAQQAYLDVEFMQLSAFYRLILSKINLLHASGDSLFSK